MKFIIKDYTRNFLLLKKIRRKKHRLIDEKTANIYTSKLLKFVDDEQPFLNPNVTLRLLAEQIEIHPNQVSWLLNEKMSKNFNEFINYYRVEHFKKLAADSIQFEFFVDWTCLRKRI